jgi:release factor glutamine methyltransferase
VAITLKKERPTTHVTGSDISADALAVARLNAMRLGALVGWVASDLFTDLGALRGTLDLIVANPPYIPTAEMGELPVDVRDFEPPMALAAGNDGLSIIKQIVSEAPAMLAPGGVLALEVGAGQAPAVQELFAGAAFEDIETERDYGGHERVVSARRSS